MRMVFLTVMLLLTMTTPAKAQELTAPEVPPSGAQRMPAQTDSFGEGLLELIQNSLSLMGPDLQEAAEVSAVVVLVAMLFSVLSIISERLNPVLEIAGVVTIATVVFQRTSSMILLATDTVRDIFEYGKLLCQGMTAALAAQGSPVSSSALYIGTTVFISLLSLLILEILLPMLYFYLAYAVAHCALGDEILKRTADAIKGCLCWLLKTLMVVFTTYMSITGVVSGTTDLAAMKSAKVVISAAVPVVGGILSDSSEAVLNAMAVIRNTAGIYGMLAVLAVFLGPFLKLGSHYLLWKVSALLCGILGNKRISALADYLSGAMSLLLAAVAAGCIMVLISTVCFMKGTG